MKRCWMLAPLVALPLLGCTALPTTDKDSSWLLPAQTDAGQVVLVIPAGGGLPIQALSLGGTFYAPLNGGPATVGLPVSP